MRKLYVIGLALSVVVMLSGCVPPQHSATPTSLPSTTQAFASDEEALAAAKVAYGEYLRVEDAIAQDGGANPDRLAGLVTPEWLAKETVTFIDFAKSGRRQTGFSAIRGFDLQSFDVGEAGLAYLTAYVCVDFSATRFLDSTGADITPTTRPSFADLQVVLELDPQRTSSFAVSGSEPWSGPSTC